jgi:crossover junction endodeoxyribonuclease RusA
MHWAAKSKVTKAYKQACWTLCRQSGMVAPDSPRIALWIDFYPPDRLSRDDDNMVASFKAGRDGIALALGIDDKRFVLHPFVQDAIGGFIKVRLTELPQ